MAKAAQNEELKAAFEKHRGETEGQIERLEQVFGMIDKKPQGKLALLSSGSPTKARRSCKNTRVHPR